jgi:hypothetical protein
MVPTTKKPLQTFKVSLEHHLHLSFIFLEFMRQELKVFDGPFHIYAWENITVSTNISTTNLI